MKKNPQKINEKEKVTEKTKTTNNKEKNEMKKGFFKKVWYSVDKIDKYSELAAEGIKSAIKYLAILMLIIGLISSAATIYKTNLKVKEIAEILNLTESNIKVRLNRGRKLLKKSLREEWIDDDE